MSALDESMDPPPGSAGLAAGARMRSGTAARLAGVPVTTLRVWERRYGVVAAPKTATGQRLYGMHDVQRLRLIKQLTDGGHAIGMLAALPLPSLQALAAGLDAAPAGPTARRRVWVVGRAAARRLHGLAGVEVMRADDDLDAALAAAASAPLDPVDVVLVQRVSLQPGDPARLAGLRRGCAAAGLVVLYAFGAEALAEQLRAAGAHVRREPASGRDLLRLVGAAVHAPRPAAGTGAAAPGRRFSDETLAALAEMPSKVACECLRHLAEIAMQLAGFERYSVDCTVRGPADAALHRELGALAAHARGQFEGALARVIAEEGIELPN